jgi:hypothetical protein
MSSLEMKFFSPIRLRPNELWPIRIAISKRASPILAAVAGRGPVQFIPVRVDKLGPANTFESTVLGSRAPLLDLGVLHKRTFPFVLNETGTSISEMAEKDMSQYMTDYDGVSVGDIYIPRMIEAGDILLASWAHGAKGADGSGR